MFEDKKYSFICTGEKLKRNGQFIEPTQVPYLLKSRQNNGNMWRAIKTLKKKRKYGYIFVMLCESKMTKRKRKKSRNEVGFSETQ